MRYWDVRAAEGMVVLTARGFDREGEFVQAVADFRAACANKRSLVLVVDVRKLVNYDPAAREAWQEAFSLENHSLKRIVYVGADAVFVRLASAAAVIMAGFAPHFIDTWDGVSIPG